MSGREAAGGVWVAGGGAAVPLPGAAGGPAGSSRPALQRLWCLHHAAQSSGATAAGASCDSAAAGPKTGKLFSLFILCLLV